MEIQVYVLVDKEGKYHSAVCEERSDSIYLSGIAVVTPLDEVYYKVFEAEVYHLTEFAKSNDLMLYTKTIKVNLESLVEDFKLLV